jgi:hypothetical protein
MYEENIYGTAYFKGIELPLIGVAELEYEDDSFDHEFGTEHCGSWTVQNIGNIAVDDSVREIVTDMFHSVGRTNHNRRLKKSVRRLERQIISYVNGLDYDAFSRRDCENILDGFDPES